MLQHYKELRGGSSSGGTEEAYDIDPYLMSLSTEKIDSDYIESRFKKYVKAFGQYDELIKDVDIDTAKKYFDQVEGADIPKRKVRAKLDELLRRFILNDGFNVL